MISVRRHAERMPERPGEMIRTELRQAGERREGDVIRDMFLDIGSHPLLLPACKAATVDRPSVCGITVDAGELVRQHDAKRLGVLPGHRAPILDLRLELESCLP